MKKASFIVAASIIIACCTTVHAQRLMTSYGAVISAITGKVTTDYSSSSFSMSQTSFCFFPRYNFVENDNSSLSIGAPVAIGLGIASNSRNDDAGVSFSYELPVALDYNIGCKSTAENEKHFGVYFGAGFSYYKVNISHSAYSNFDGATYGPLARAGCRIGSSNENWGGHAITIGLFYKKGLEKTKFNTFGAHVLYDL